MPGAAAQVPAEVTGRVARFAGADTVPVVGAEIVLHRVAEVNQGPLDSMAVDRRGRFRFRFLADTTAIYLLSVRHHGITYFSSPVARDPDHLADDILLIVSDTSAAAPVGLAARSLIIGAVEPSGARRVVEVVEIANRGQQTRVAPDSVATLAIALPRGIGTAFVEETDLSPDAVLIRGDSLLVFAPLAPGERVVVVQYLFPAGVRRLTIPPGAAVDTVQVLLEGGGLRLHGTLSHAGDEVVEGRGYSRWIGPWSGTDPLIIETTGVAVPPGLLLTILVAALALTLGAGWMVLQRRRSAVPGAPLTSRLPPRSAAELLDALARLDARFQAQPSAAAAEDRARYEAERTRLKTELQRALASERTAP